MATKAHINIEVLDGGYVVDSYSSNELAKSNGRVILTQKNKVIKLLKELLDLADKQVLMEELPTE